MRDRLSSASGARLWIRGVWISSITTVSRHRGLLTFEASKLTRAQWNLAIARGDMELRHRDVARLYGAKSTQEMRIEAAVLAAGPGALASHRSAALLWGVERPAADPVDIIMPRWSRQARLADVVVHRPVRPEATPTCLETGCRRDGSLAYAPRPWRSGSGRRGRGAAAAGGRRLRDTVDRFVRPSSGTPSTGDTALSVAELWIVGLW